MKCEICNVARVTRDDTVCRACDAQLAHEQLTFIAPAPKRFCRDCRDPLPRHRYFKCEACDPTIARGNTPARPSEDAWDGFEDHDIGEVSL